jgi:5'-3' exonuclease
MSILYTYKGSYKEIYNVLDILQTQGHKMLFVFDGKSPIEKEQEVKERRDTREGAASHAEKIRDYLESGEISRISENERKILEDAIHRLENTAWHLTRAIRHEIQAELIQRKIPYIRGIEEADGVLIDLCGAGKLDVIVSTDMDYLLSGVVPRLWIPIKQKKDAFEEICIKDVFDTEGITAESFRDAGILCGVEPLRGKLSIHANRAFIWIRHYKSIEKLLASNIREAQLECLREKENLTSVRNHFIPRIVWTSRIREDHIETLLEFVN